MEAKQQKSEKLELQKKVKKCVNCSQYSCHNFVNLGPNLISRESFAN